MSDKHDAAELVRLYPAGELTAAHIQTDMEV
jgi:hypothetical protein